MSILYNHVKIIIKLELLQDILINIHLSKINVNIMTYYKTFPLILQLGKEQAFEVKVGHLGKLLIDALTLSVTSLDFPLSDMDVAYTSDQVSLNSQNKGTCRIVR